MTVGGQLPGGPADGVPQRLICHPPGSVIFGRGTAAGRRGVGGGDAARGQAAESSIRGGTVPPAGPSCRRAPLPAAKPRPYSAPNTGIMDRKGIYLGPAFASWNAAAVFPG